MKETFHLLGVTLLNQYGIWDLNPGAFAYDMAYKAIALTN